jgi:uncharacterized membrane protein
VKAENNSLTTGETVQPDTSNVQLIYILYLVGIIVFITAVVGVIMAYVNRGKNGAWLDTHYTWLIRTFWIGLVYGLIGAVTTVIFVGIFIWLFAFVWFLVRMIKGLQALGRKEPIANPQSWMFG